MTTTAYKISDAMKERVLKALEGMHSIARAEMMQQVGYLEMDVKPRRRTSVCQGHQACAIGSLWLAAGIRVRHEWGRGYLPGTNQYDRAAFTENRPVLKHALRFLNEAATEYMVQNGVVGNPLLNRDAVESLFESEWFLHKYAGEDAYKARRAAMLKVISAAKRKVRAA